MGNDNEKHDEQIAVEAEQIKIDTLNTQARELQDSEPERALALATDAYQRSQSGHYAVQPYVQGIADSLGILAWYQYEHASNYVAALEYSSEALSYSKNIGHIAGQIRALYQQGLIHHRIGNYPQALNNYLDALGLAREHHDTYHEAQTLRAISIIYIGTEDNEKALDYCEVALKLFNDLQDEYHTALMLNNISMYHTMAGDFHQALEFAFQSLSIFIKIDSWRGKSIVEDTIAQAFAGLGEYDKAIEYALKTLEEIIKHGSKLYQTQSLLNVGKIYLQSKRPDQALPHLQQALALAQTIGSKAHIYESHEQLSLVYEQRGDTQQSLLHLKQYVAVHNEVVNNQSLEKLTLLEVAYRTKQAEAEAETQRQLRQQIQRYHERLAQVRDQLISTASQDLKNPLGAILNYVYLLRLHDTTQDETSRDYLDHIESQVEQMRDLISDLLDLARLETGRALECKLVSLGHFITPIVVENMSQAQAKNIRLETMAYAEDLMINIDPRQMRRVLNNLISNAIEYTPEAGRITIRVAHDLTTATITVEDTGIGIAAEDLPHIFERFYRVNHTGRDQADGSGLGLAIVKLIVEQHGGTVGVSSEVGKGSQFYITIPLSVGDEATPKLSGFAAHSG